MSLLRPGAREMFEQLVSSDLGTAKTDDLPIMILVKHRAQEIIALPTSEGLLER